MPEPLVSRCVAEFVGTFFLVLAAHFGTGLAAPVVLITQIFAFGHVSGAHFNPAVTVAMAVFEGRRMKASVVVSYIVSQIVAALFAVIIGIVLVGHVPPAAVAPMDAQFARSFLTEFLGTFALVTTIIHVAVLQPDNSFFGLAIGLAVLGGGLLLGQYGTTTFNPAVLLAGVVIRQLPIKFLATYATQLLAAALAAVMAKLVGLNTRRKLMAVDTGCCSRIEEPLVDASDNAAINSNERFTTF
eukprot:TRINITY_DN94_c0_g1_i2.p1 TRINITY_DN94_c0_g1~~TRINITY_DN94_c0_g1_i2.p1  ORF type:complete len:243 (-),score=85.52 TRINITY_DN94_c0_g1_i2:61-789(-)